MNITDIALISFSGDYQGSIPTITGVKTGDLACDTCTGVVWEWTGVCWTKKATIGGGKFILGEGSTIAEILSKEDTYIPNSLLVKAGDDPSVPEHLRTSAENLAIYHGFGNPPAAVFCLIHNKTEKFWYNIASKSSDVVSDEAGDWTIWYDFLSKVKNKKCIVSLLNLLVNEDWDEHYTDIASGSYVHLTNDDRQFVKDLNVIGNVESSNFYLKKGDVYKRVLVDGEANVDEPIQLSSSNYDINTGIITVVAHGVPSGIANTITSSYIGLIPTSVIQADTQMKYTLDVSGLAGINYNWKVVF